MHLVEQRHPLLRIFRIPYSHTCTRILNQVLTFIIKEESIDERIFWKAEKLNEFLRFRPIDQVVPRFKVQALRDLIVLLVAVLEDEQAHGLHDLLKHVLFELLQQTWVIKVQELNKILVEGILRHIFCDPIEDDALLLHKSLKS